MQQFIESHTDGASLEMIQIRGGSFQMGSNFHPWEQPIHKVDIPSFYLSKYPITNEQFLPFINEKVADIDDNPTWLNLKGNYLGVRFGIKKSLQEFECIKGHNENSHQETKPVGMKLPNKLGLFDMSGLTWEWCSDLWQDNYKNAPNDGSSLKMGIDENLRTVRGGFWCGNEDYARITCRFRFEYFVSNFLTGFRLAHS